MWARRILAGFLGIGLPVTTAIFALDVVRWRCIMPYWWLLGPALCLGAGVAYGCLRARLSPALAGILAIPLVLLLYVLAAPSIYHWDGMVGPARITFHLVDRDERPLPGVEFVVQGETWEWGAWFDEDTRGFAPIYEYGGRPLRTDAEGQLVVRQVPMGISGDGYQVFGIRFSTSDDPPDHTLEFRREGYRPRVLGLRALRRQAPPTSGERVARIDVRVVMQPGG